VARALKHRWMAKARIVLWLYLVSACVSSSPVVARSPLPHKLVRGQVLSIPLSQSHPRKLAVRNPLGQYVHLVDDEAPHRLMSEAEFSAMNSLVLSDEATVGTMYVDGKPVRTAVFIGPGVYLVYLADILETEPENTNFVDFEVEYQ
jgi:hypothetical protein